MGMVMKTRYAQSYTVLNLIPLFMIKQSIPYPVVQRTRLALARMLSTTPRYFDSG